MATATYALTISGLHYGKRLENVMHFTGDPADGSNTLAEGKDLIDSFVDAAELNFLNCLPPTYQILRYSANVVHPRKISNVPHMDVTNAAKNGSFGTEAQSDNLCPSITLIPPMGIKSPGRIFMPCIAKEAIANNVYTGTYVTDLDIFMQSILADFAISSTQWHLAVYSRKNDTAVRALAYTTSPAIGFQSKRRRPV